MDVQEEHGSAHSADSAQEGMDVASEHVDENEECLTGDGVPIARYIRGLARVRRCSAKLNECLRDLMELEADDELPDGEGGEEATEEERQQRQAELAVLRDMSIMSDLNAVRVAVRQLGASAHATGVWIDFLKACGTQKQMNLGFFGFLPDELILHVFRFLDPMSLCRCNMVSKTWRALSNEECLWERKTKEFWPDIKDVCTRIQKPWKWIFQSKYRQFYPGELRDGCGWHALPNGNRFYGDWKNDKRHGWGVNVMSNGRIYEGQYVEDKRNGWGLFRWPGGHQHAGDTYVGEWKDSKRHGWGTYMWADGRVYEGKWDNDKRAGGRSTYPDGQSYEGEYVNGKRHGIGTTSYPTGEVFRGHYVSNKRSGRGELTWPDGAKFDGNWVRGARQGPGLLHMDGRVYEQEWREDKFDLSDRGLDSPCCRCALVETKGEGNGSVHKAAMDVSESSEGAVDASHENE
eukprot:TRINITY_DN5771_c0_g2_i1.p1 TRINITY_DN5771_c0_g2~~TRINITY_DN5771_c0_g2_i1.p1  ORF type:complete len:506 (+),score=128.26 TRINITY_DN5771_c0_g2_i1:138-1520(+)